VEGPVLKIINNPKMINLLVFVVFSGSLSKFDMNRKMKTTFGVFTFADLVWRVQVSRLREELVSVILIFMSPLVRELLLRLILVDFSHFDHQQQRVVHKTLLSEKF
jgi:hypothetical protein